MNKTPLKALVAALLLALLPVAAWSADPTVHDVYVLADSGRMQEAQQLMQQVLRDHPNSGKAHFVEAELLARQNQMSAARGEFATAERLSPGLTFESPSSVQNLRARLFSSSAPSARNVVGMPAASHSSIAGPLIIGGLLLIVIVMVVRSLMRRAATPVMNPSMLSSNPPPYGSGYGYGPGMQPPMSGGMGSGLMGSLATGAALGAGLVAGEALAHNLVDGNSSHQSFTPPPPQDNVDDNLGGNDFGLSDASSWDSGGGGDGGGGWD